GEVERRARTVRTMDHGDGLVGQSKAGVELCDGGIVPTGDLAQEDVAERCTVEDQIAGLDAFDVHNRDYSAHDHRELGKAGGFEVFAFQRRVGGSESDGLCLDLLDAATRAYGLVVEADAGFLLV